MQNLLMVAFEAHHAQRNRHRRYQVTIGRDLLNDWVLTIHYGRTGQGGHEQQFANTNAGELQRTLRERLRRRLSAPRRIGCSYRLKEFSVADGFDSHAWLPGEVIAKFLSISVIAGHLGNDTNDSCEGDDKKRQSMPREVG